jgi:hypothetical protein
VPVLFTLPAVPSSLVKGADARSGKPLFARGGSGRFVDVISYPHRRLRGYIALRVFMPALDPTSLFILLECPVQRCMSHPSLGSTVPLVLSF